ncbi:RNA polymerase sigma factor [Terracidiphilus gabretensis]|jgi:RNA polymerase sigma-70 factor, ECF subfamily|uniref:RNA polymerase sigma factor n=1 Tax=Terracidiphilus gabretensis TaxID=1577687 RepID=UPI0009EBF4E6|nr:sigma-70 family RNA polymerase sigma factor [Terracidiphilus gabretensis]
MLFRARSIRASSDLFSNEPAGRTGSGRPLGDPGLPSRTGGGGGSRSASGAENEPEDPASEAEPESNSAQKPQPSQPGGVTEDMATLTINPVVGASSAKGSAADSNMGPHMHAEALDPASDAAIMLRVAAGDEAGFNYLVTKYHRAMVHFLYRMVRTQAVAEELAQEVFLRVYRSRESYRAEAKFTTWLYRIATNLAVNHARDTRHERAAHNVYLDVPDEETGTTPEIADDELNVEQRILRDERMAAIRNHVQALPERQRMAVLMHKYQGLDYRQIGEVLKLSESATKSLLFRAYQTLRETLKDFV